MEPELIIKSIMTLVVILMFLMFFLFFEPNKKKKEEEKKSSAKASERSLTQKPDFKSLVKIVKERDTDSATLSQTLELIIKHYGTIEKKIGLRVHPDSYIYTDIIFTICRHPNTNKHIIINFDKALRRLNPEYKKEINEALTKGLNSRGA